MMCELNEYTLKRQLADESIGRFGDEVVEMYDDAFQRRRLFVVDWMDSTDGQHIMAFGADARGTVLKMPINLTPGLFVLTRDLDVLRTVCRLYGRHRVIDYPRIELHNGNNFAAHEILSNYKHVVGQRSCLAKIECETLAQSRVLFHRLRNETDSYRYAAVPFYWSNVTQIMLELIVRYGVPTSDEKIPNTMAWFDEDLNYYPTMPSPEIPLITFDIETVSTDPNRVPTGEDADDELFSVSVHRVFEKKLYTLIYLPLPAMTRDEARDRVIADGYFSECPEDTNELEVFVDEVDLLRRTMSLLALPRLHYLVGYNSMNYDIKYLLMRCAFFNLPQREAFVYRDGYAFTWSQLHVDLFRVIMMRNKFQHYGLNDVARELLKETKKDVSAVALRHLFHAMRDNQRFYPHEECHERWPSVRETLMYNNQDTVLVSRLIECTDALAFVRDEVNRCGIPYFSLSANYNKMRYKLWSRCFVRALLRGLYFTTFKDPAPVVRCPIRSEVYGSDVVVVPLRLENQLNDDPCRASAFEFQLAEHMQARKKYPGGANFCHGKYDVTDMAVLDYRIAYPLYIERMNVSDETTSVLPANVLLAFRELGLDEHEASEFRTFDYTAHTGANRTESSVLYHQYIYNGRYCGGEFAFTNEELARRGESAVIVIWQGRRGVLPTIIQYFNEDRESVKSRRNMLKGIADELNDRANTLRTIAAAIENANNECDDDDDEESAAVDWGDDDDWGNNEHFGDSEVIEMVPPPAERARAAVPNPFGLRFVNEYVWVNENRTCGVNEEALNELPIERRLEILRIASEAVALERQLANDEYNLMKAVVSSIYGCIGTSSPVCASVITCGIRTTLLQAAQYLVKDDYTVYYIDTDSLFVKHRDPARRREDPSPRLNRLFPHTEIELSRLARTVLIKTKVHLDVKETNSAIKYGQHVNGPVAWREFVNFAFGASSLATTRDVRRMFVDFFNGVYDELCAHKSVTPQFLARFSQIIKVRATAYRTRTPISRYRDWVAEHYPAMANSFKHRVYMILGNSATDVQYRPVCSFTQMSQLRDVNLFKYYQNNFSTVFYIIETHLRRNNEPFRIAVAPKIILHTMFDAFNRVHEARFSIPQADARSDDNDDVDLVLLTDYGDDDAYA